VKRFGLPPGMLGALPFELPKLRLKSGDVRIEVLRYICVHAYSPFMSMHS
jgi:hypothetical protein